MQLGKSSFLNTRVYLVCGENRGIKLPGTYGKRPERTIQWNIQRIRANNRENAVKSLRKLGNTLSDDQLPADRFDYMLANPPFGVDWKKVEGHIKNEH
ncbi:MAG TPA: N-6 DNA methylase, partial [Nitrosomonas sp.]|nr:N-6 DNA methylase [Nitrosomonas sp.]